MTQTPYRQVPGLLATRQPFEGNSMSAIAGERAGQHMTGRLDNDKRQQFVNDSHAGIVYLVVSYGTPIAWQLATGEVYHVSQRFSRTTSRHQALARAWLQPA